MVLNFYTSMQECSTLWRLYEYLADEEQEHTLRTREERRNLSLGEGGEGYIAADKWCYNCGSCGHWGDVSPPPRFLVPSVKAPSRTAKMYRAEIFPRNPPLSAHTIRSRDPSLMPNFHSRLPITASLESGSIMTVTVRGVMTYRKMLANRVGGRTLKGWNRE